MQGVNLETSLEQTNKIKTDQSKSLPLLLSILSSKKRNTFNHYTVKDPSDVGARIVAFLANALKALERGLLENSKDDLLVINTPQVQKAKTIKEREEEEENLSQAA